MFKARYYLSKKEVKKLKAKLPPTVKVAEEVLKGKGRVEVGLLSRNFKVYLVNGLPLLIEVNEEVYPAVNSLVKGLVKVERGVVVDDGAVPHILNGADVMVPGIVRVEGGFKEGDVVVVYNLKGTPVAVGKALMDSEVVKTSKKGKAIKNVHYIGDSVWRLGK